MISVLTIGQSPRPDLMAEIAAVAPAVPATLYGALDGLDRDAIGAMAPHDAADTLYTRLPDGSDILVSKHHVTARLGEIIEQTRGVVLLGCTGGFTGLPQRPDLVVPSMVLNALAASLLPRGRLGLVVPLATQVPTLESLRARDGLAVRAVALKPFSDDAARRAAADRLLAFAPDMILLDCISYNRADRAAFARHGVPVLLAVDVAARIAASLCAH